MRLSVLTAVSRPWNLGLLAQSLTTASRNAPAVDVSWHCRFDPIRLHVGGQTLKNWMLADIHDGWVWILDDDTIAHDHVLARVSEVVDAKPKLEAVVVAQRRVDGRVLHAHPDNNVVGEIDAGQAFLKRSLITEEIPPTYAGDGAWLETTLANARVGYLDEVLSLHNQITGIDVSEPVERMT